MIEPGGPFYDMARSNPFRGLIRVHDRVWGDGANFNLDERVYSCGILLHLAASYAFRVNEKFRRRSAPVENVCKTQRR
jgi:hypothetical protein